MKKIVLLLLLLGILAVVSIAVANDVTIDQDGNLTTGASTTDANLEVIGSSGEDGIIGSSSGTGATGVYGENSTSGNYGFLGDDQYGVYGYSLSGNAGYFHGNAVVTGTLTVGTLLGYSETDPQVGTLTDGQWCTTDGTVVNCTSNAPLLSEADPIYGASPSAGISSLMIGNWDTAYGWGDHSSAGYDLTNDSWTGTGDVYMTSGNVGIGTNTPQGELEVAADQQSSNLYVTGYKDTISPGMFIGRKARGNMAYPGAVQQDDILAAFGGSGYGSTAWSSTRGRMNVLAAESWTDSAQGTYITFQTTSTGFTSRSERMRITAEGNVGIGTTAPTEKFTVAGTIESTSGGVKFPDGTVQTTASAMVLTQVPTLNTTNTLDSAGDVGKDSSITIGADGLPVISYRDDTSADLKVAKCLDMACSSVTISIVDSTGDVGSDTSIAIGIDGFPVISYHDATNSVLKVAHCSDISCTASTLQSIDSDGTDTSIAIGIDGLPVISYLYFPSFDLRVAKCNDSSCTSATITTVDTTGIVGKFSSIAIGVDGLPVISYLLHYDLKVAKCLDAACSTSNVTTVDSDGNPGWFTSLTIGEDGLPFISYYVSTVTGGDLKVAKCGDTSCSTSSTLTIIDFGGNVGLNTSVTIGRDGLPVIAYYDMSNSDLKVAKCLDASCLSAAVTVVDSAGWIGNDDISITLGVDGYPVISYYDASNQDLKVAKCINAFCLNNWTRR